MRWWGCLLLGALALPVWAAPQPLQLLLDRVRADSSARQREDGARLERFIEAHDRQQEYLAQARAELQARQDRSAVLERTLHENERLLKERTRRLEELRRETGDLGAVFRDVSAELASSLEGALAAVENPGLLKRAQGLATAGEGMPTVQALEDLWVLLLEQAVGGARVASFPAQVLAADGSTVPQDITRVGEFALLSREGFLALDPATGRVTRPAHQPGPGALRRVRNYLEAAPGSYADLDIDPTRGYLLGSAGAQGAGLWDRLRQGGPIGYLILALGLVAALVAAERFVWLTRAGRRVAAQRRREQPVRDNPLGRVLGVVSDPHVVDAETLGLRVDEAILRELPALQRGLGLLAIIATVTPLLGLLGTVTGIIGTFHTLSLAGAGDPRLMSGDIALALVTTVLGLGVAVPVLLIHSMLRARSNRIIQTLDEEGARLMVRAAERNRAI